MDKETRNRIQRATQAARVLLEHEYAEQLEGVFDIRLDGAVAKKPGKHLNATQRVLRVKLVAAVEHHHAAGMNMADAVAAYLREAAFTTLNRFVALKMLEARDLVQECISRSDQSAGFREFTGLAAGLVQLPDHGYHVYIDALFDELSLHVRVLFNRRDAASLLWPRRACLESLLAALNSPELAGIWPEDETIGWIYQYYNDEAERKKMREESAAPRNSRELAVRNQFFTPRYVVEFLTDNTLGRLWYEMTRGETVLRDRCRYLVRRPTEIFLKPGESIPENTVGREADVEKNLSQEELLRQPVHIPHRPLKDPREIRLLDPACGSMHFGLYAFDLFTVIYDEAWEIVHGSDDAAKSAETFAPFVAFATTFPDKAAFLREVPRLIVEHNIHGIDIDPRAAQIAGLSLWLRAQRAWHQAGVKPADRPRITRSNLVCAEPMPGEKELLREFVEQQFPAGERPAFAFLLETIFDHMTLAGEAGSLLRIEEEIRTAIADAKRLWKQGPKAEQASLFAEPGEKAGQGEMRLDLSGITDEQFWERAEQRIYDALEAYAGQAENGGGFQRRLFADDTAQGFAFIDLCRKRYDVVVMNPPFGSPPDSVASMLSPDAASNIYPAFVLRGAELCDGFVGAITDRTFLVQQSFGKFRNRLISDLGVIALAELGWGVLDGADVQVATYFVRKGHEHVHLFVSVNSGEGDPADYLRNIIAESRWTALSEELIRKLPSSAFAHTLPAAYLSHLESQASLRDLAALPRGLGSNDANRTYKAWYEVPIGSIGEGRAYRSLSNGGPSSPFYRDDAGVAEWLRRDGKLLVEHGYSETSKAYDQKGNPLYFAAGLSFPKQATSFNVSALPEDAIPTREGKGVVPNDAVDRLVLLAYLNSAYARYFVEATNGLHKQSGPVGMTPVPRFSPAARAALSSAAIEGWRTIAKSYLFDEASRIFVRPAVEADSTQLGDCDLSAIFQTIDDVVFDQVGVGTDDRVTLTAQPRPGTTFFKPADSDALDYALGCAFGRWDIRYATGERPAPELPDPFAPLPVCPPGMLQGDDSLPLSPEAGRRLRAEGRYPLEVVWDGILVDDAEHPLDLEHRGHAALAVLWADRADALEHEACALLGVPTLREWFRRPAGFFADHLKRYSKSRRKAPIYWPLSTASGSYTLWLYYHRFSKDTLYRALELAQEKLSYEERKLSRMTTDVGSGSGAAERKAVAGQESFVAELRVFQAELTRVAPLWDPNLNDGVILNYGPVWRMICHKPWQKTVKADWDQLVAGKYDWAHLAMHLWPERVVPKCATDRSLAIAHGLEGALWREDSAGKWQPRTISRTEMETLITERTSAAVKDALKSLLAAPTLTATRPIKKKTLRKALSPLGGEA